MRVLQVSLVRRKANLLLLECQRRIGPVRVYQVLLNRSASAIRQSKT